MKCANINATAVDTGVYFLQFGPTSPWDGCDNHPTATQQRYMAENYVIPFVKQILV